MTAETFIRMNPDSAILTIAIPTYNRAARLQAQIERLLKGQEILPKALSETCVWLARVDFNKVPAVSLPAVLALTGTPPAQTAVAPAPPTALPTAVIQEGGYGVHVIGACLTAFLRGFLGR